MLRASVLNRIRRVFLHDRIDLDTSLLSSCLLYRLSKLREEASSGNFSIVHPRKHYAYEMMETSVLIYGR